MSDIEIINYAKAFSLEKMLAQAKWYHDDLKKGGWDVIYEKKGKSTWWLKTFPNEEIPIKVLYKMNIPLSAEQFIEVLDPKNIEYRRKWDKGFFDNEVLKEYPDGGGYLLYNRVATPWPLADRTFLVFTAAGKEVDWYGQRSYLVPYFHATHKSKPANAGPYVRATNGGQSLIITPDVNDPEHSCTLFGLSHNLYNGWIPSSVKTLFSRAVPKGFSELYDDLVEGYKMFFADKE